MKKIRLGAMELQALFALEQNGAGVVTLAELKSKLRLSGQQARKLASRLAKKRRLIRLKRGVYLFAPMKAGPRGLWTENALASVHKLMGKKAYYVGFWACLSHYGLTEQVPLTVQIVTPARQRPLEALQSRFEFIQVRRLGEWREEKIGDGLVRFATVEQLIIDCLTLPEKSGGMKEACKALWGARKIIDRKKLEALAARSKDAVRRRLGYLCELLGVHWPKPKKPVGWRWLDPSAPKKLLAKSARWGLLLNVSERELLEWREH